MGLPKDTAAIGSKRKLSSNDAAGERPTKHRSSQACQACRHRKVRCDVLSNGTRCTNCRLDSMECVVLASRRGKTTKPHPARPSEPTEDPVPIPTPMATPSVTPTGQVSTADVPLCVTFDEDDQVDESVGDDRSKSSTGHAPALATPEKLHLSPPGVAPLPSFIDPLPDFVLAEDWAFLAQKGALTVPEPAILAEILQSYIFSVHPFMPIVDLGPFVDSMMNEREGGGTSLLLFQAVMFAGLASLEPHFVHSMGFGCTKQAREVFFDRVKLLYEFDVEPDSTAVLRSLLLMSWWYGKWNRPRHTWYWTGLALSVAQNMGLHREPTGKGISPTVRRTRRRLWWSLYIRDRLLAMGTRRPSRIRDDDFDVTMLTLEDFDVEPGKSIGQEHLLLLDGKENTRTASMCIELAKLSVCIGHVLSSQYTTLSTQPDIPQTTMVMPRNHGERTLDDLKECDRELNAWSRALSSNVRRSEWPAPGSSHSCSEVHWATLNMAHLTLLGVLHRTQALQPLSDTAEAQVVQEASRMKVKDAARRITKLAHTMLCRDQVRFMGVPGITALLSACLSHLRDIRSGDEDVRDASILRFYQSMQVLQALRSTYASADSAVSFLASVIRKAGISVTAQVTTPAPECLSASTEGLAVPMMTGGKDGDWDIASAPQARRWTMTHAQVTTARPDSCLNLPTQAYQYPTRLSDPDGRVSPAKGMLPPSAQSVTAYSTAPAFGATSYAPDMSPQAVNPAKQLHTTEGNMAATVATSSVDFSDMAATEPFLAWNSSLDMGIDLKPLPFGFDFGSDTFGFLDGQLQGM